MAKIKLGDFVLASFHSGRVGLAISWGPAAENGAPRFRQGGHQRPVELHAASKAPFSPSGCVGRGSWSEVIGTTKGRQPQGFPTM